MATMPAIDDLKNDLFQNGQWHADSFKILYHELMQDPRPFAMLHHHRGFKELCAYRDLIELAVEYITATHNHVAVRQLETIIYQDRHAFWRSFTARISRDSSYNERHFMMMSLMWECAELSRRGVCEIIPAIERG